MVQYLFHFIAFVDGIHWLENAKLYYNFSSMSCGSKDGTDSRKIAFLLNVPLGTILLIWYIECRATFNYSNSLEKCFNYLSWAGSVNKLEVFY